MTYGKWDGICLFVGFAQKGRDYETMGSFQLVQYGDQHN